MSIFKNVCLIALALSLSACLKVTGEAKDPFDLEDEEDKFDVGGLPVFDRQSDTGATAPRADTEQRLNNAEEGRPADNASAGDFAPAGPDSSGVPQDSTQLQSDFVEYERWRKARAEGNADDEQYQEFLEFKEYQEWLRLKEAQQQAQ